MAEKKKISTRAPRSSNSRLDAHTWLERAQAIQIYSSALKDADDKVLRLFDTVSDQTKRYFEFNTRLYVASILIIILMILISFGLAVFASKDNLFFQIFSLVGLASAIITLILLISRNPLKHARQMLENTVRVNVVFLSFVRRLQQSDLALRFLFMQKQGGDFNKMYAQLQEFQNMVDQTSEELNRVLQDFGE